MSIEGPFNILRVAADGGSPSNIGLNDKIAVPQYVFLLYAYVNGCTYKSQTR